MPRPQRIDALLRAIRHPVPPDTRAALSRAWHSLDPALRGPRQFLGRQYAGCGALIGAMPRCDFACHGCYLGAEANRIPAAPLEEIERQMHRLRAWLGEGGNVQITDGEVTLRAPEELLSIVRCARRVGLVPMLMTHGEGLRRRPELLRRLMIEGGLREMSVHIDTTQRGRRDPAYRRARRERDLDPLRDEFAALIRSVRRETGRPLHVASTVTVTRENLDGVGGVIRWMLANADAFKMVSFQPAVQVGRTAEGLGGGVTVEALWQKIAEGLSTDVPVQLDAHKGWLGHPDCSHFVQGAVRRRPGEDPVFVPLVSAAEDAAIGELLDRLGGLTFRLDSRAQAAARLVGALAAAPGVAITRLVPALARLHARVVPGRRLRFWLDRARGRAGLHYFNIVSHHFMSRTELETPRGRERVAACAFRVPIGDRLVSMCEANALGERERYYATLRNPGRPDTGVSA